MPLFRNLFVERPS